MRTILHGLVNIIEYNKVADKLTLIDHSYARVYYNAYEACIKDWYEERKDDNLESEKHFRLATMTELLYENGMRTDGRLITLIII